MSALVLAESYRQNDNSFLVRDFGFPDQGMQFQHQAYDYASASARYAAMSGHFTRSNNGLRSPYNRLKVAFRPTSSFTQRVPLGLNGFGWVRFPVNRHTKTLSALRYGRRQPQAPDEGEAEARVLVSLNQSIVPTLACPTAFFGAVTENWGRESPGGRNSLLDTVPGGCPVSRQRVLWVTVPRIFVSGENGTGTVWGFMHRMIRRDRAIAQEDCRLVALSLDRRREHPS